MPLNDIAVTRFPAGVNNVAVGDILNSLRFPDPTQYHTYFNDFDTYLASEWTVTETQAGATQALTDGDNGLLLLTNTAADNDLISLQKVGESFRFAVGKKCFYKARFQVNDAVQSDVVFGLLITDTTPLDVTDGVFFIKDDGAATISFVAEKDNVQVSAAAVASIPSATFVELAFFYDGIDRIYYAVGGSVLGFITPGASFPNDEDLTVSFALQNGEAVAKTMTVDYIFVAQER